MVDPVTAISATTAAFSLIKKGFDAGRDIESMYSEWIVTGKQFPRS